MSVRFGIVGAGGIAGLHLQSLKEIEDAEVVAISDVDTNTLANRKQEFGIRDAFENYDELFKVKDLDAVLICLPTYLHCDAVTKAAQRGLDIFCEKPMALTLQEADQMIEVCEQHSVKLMIGFVRRFCPEWGKFKEVVEQGLLGRPVVWRMAFAGYGAPTAWFHDRKKGGGAFLDGMVHNYDFGNYLFGEVAEVKSSLVRLRESTTALDTGTAIVNYKSGDQIAIMGSWGLPKGSSGSYMHDALGPNGALFFSDPDNDPGDIDTSKYRYLVFKGENGEKKRFPFEKENMFVKELIYFIDCIKKNVKPIPGGKDGRESLEVALKVLGEL